MIRRLALVCGLAVLSTVALESQSQAQVTQDVNFNGSVVGVCTFTGTTAGTLATQNSNAWLEASNGTTIGTIGTSGQTTVRCTNGGQLSVSAPVKVTAPTAFVDTVRQAVVYDSTANAFTSAGGPFDNSGWSKPTAALAMPINTDRVLRIGAVVGVNNTTGGVPFGTYSYRVTLTATPN